MNRRIQAMKMQDIVPAKDVDGVPEFRFVSPGELMVDGSYQRNLSERSVSLIRRIVAGWDWKAFKPPVVADVAGVLHVLDGQHTAIAAASHPKIMSIPVMVVSAEEEKDRASAFVKHNRDRINVTPAQIHFALVQAGDEDAVTVENVCQRTGVKILRNPPAYGRFNPGETMAVAALRALVNRRYPIGARKVLEVCVAAMLSPITADSIKAVETILFDEEYCGSIEPENLSNTIRRMASAADAEAAQFAAAHKVPKWKGLVVVWFRNTRKTRRAA